MTYVTHIASALLLTIAILLTTLFGAVHTVFAQCPTPDAMGVVSINHAVCQPAGPGVCTGAPKAPGHDGFPCQATVPVGVVKGACVQGCCSVVAPSTCTAPEVTSSKQALDMAGFGKIFGQSLAGSLGQSIGKMLVDKLLGGGGYDGGSTGGTMPPLRDFGTDTGDDQDFLNFGTDGSSDTDDSLGFGQFSFGSNGGDSSDSGGFIDDTDNVVDTATGGTQTSGDTAPPTNTGSSEQEERVPTDPDSVATTYEYVDASGNTVTRTEGSSGVRKAAGVAESETTLSQEIRGTRPGLTRAELELQGLREAQRLGTLHQFTQRDSTRTPYKSLTPAEVRELRNYERSSVAVSGDFVSGGRFAEQETEPTQEQSGGFLRGIVQFIASLFGF